MERRGAWSDSPRLPPAIGSAAGFWLGFDLDFGVWPHVGCLERPARLGPACSDCQRQRTEQLGRLQDGAPIATGRAHLQADGWIEGMGVKPFHPADRITQGVFHRVIETIEVRMGLKQRINQSIGPGGKAAGEGIASRNQNHHHKLQAKESLVAVPDSRLSPLTPADVQTTSRGPRAPDSLQPCANSRISGASTACQPSTAAPHLHGPGWRNASTELSQGRSFAPERPTGSNDPEESVCWPIQRWCGDLHQARKHSGSRQDQHPGHGEAGPG